MTATTAWALVGLCAAFAFAIRALGPVLLGGRDLPAWFTPIITSMAPALLGALVVVNVFADDRTFSVGADTAGVAAGGVVLWRGANQVVAVVIAVALTAGLRALA